MRTKMMKVVRVFIVACCYFLVIYGADYANAHTQTQRQQMQNHLSALEHELQDGLARATAAHTALVYRLDTSRALIRDMFANEAEETKLYLQETRLKASAIREVVQLEMQNVRREVEQLVASAKANLSALAQRREILKQEKLMQLKRARHEKKRQQQQSRDDEGEGMEDVETTVNVSSTKSNSRWNRFYELIQTAFYAVNTLVRRYALFATTVMLVLLSLVVGGLAIQKYIAQQRAKHRNRILYSGYLKSYPRPRPRAAAAGQKPVQLQLRSRSRTSSDTSSELN